MATFQREQPFHIPLHLRTQPVQRQIVGVLAIQGNFFAPPTETRIAPGWPIEANANKDTLGEFSQVLN